MNMKTTAIFAVALGVTAAAFAAPKETVIKGLTPEQALAKVREMKSSKTFPDGDVVFEMEGTYSFPKGKIFLDEFGGVSPSARVVFRAGKKGATFTGACVLPKTAFAKVKDPAVLKRLRPEVRGKVLCCDLKPYGADKLEQLPDTIRAWNGMEFVAGGEPQTIARYPNSGWLSFTLDDVVDSGTEMNPNLKELRGVRGGTFRYAADDPRPGSWDVSKGVWMLGFWNNDWTSDTLRIASIDGEKHTVTSKGVHYLGIGPFNKSPVGRRYYFLNLLEELDAPGEWYVDCETAVLYWYPPAKIPDDLKFINHAEPILHGDQAHDIVFEGIRFDGNTAEAIYLHNCHRVTLKDCEISYITRNGINILGGTEFVMDGCKVHHIGANGVVLEAGNRRLQTPCKFHIVNCEIWRTGRFVTNGRGLMLEGVGMHVEHNYFHDLPYNGLTYRGNDHLIEFNEVAFAMLESGDGGGFYSGRDWSCQGNIVRYNYLHHFGAHGAQEKQRLGQPLFCEPLSHDDSNGIYLDDCVAGNTCYGNLLLDVGYGFQLGGGRDNRIYNNVVVNCQHGGALVDARGFKALRFEGGSCNGWNQKLRMEQVDWEKGPFRKKYPWTADYFTNDKYFPVRTFFSSNIVVNCKNVIGQGSCAERKDFVHDMNFRGNLQFGPRGPRDNTLYPEGKYAEEVVFKRDAAIEKLFAETHDLRQVVGSREFRKAFPRFPRIPVKHIGKDK